jgi:hypothetical protein
MDGTSIAVIATASITAQVGTTVGALTIAQIVDLSPVNRSLAPNTDHATLIAPSGQLALVGTGTPPVTALRIPITTSLGPSAAGLALVVAPRSSSRIDWVSPVRYAALGLAGALLMVYMIGRSRGRKLHP